MYNHLQHHRRVSVYLCKANGDIIIQPSFNNDLDGGKDTYTDGNHRVLMVQVGFWVIITFFYMVGYLECRQKE